VKTAFSASIRFINALCIGSFIVLSGFFTAHGAQSSGRVETELDTGWLYNASDVSNGQSVSLSETGWTKVCVPHANVITKHAYQSESAFRIISWYRRHITIPSEYSGKRFLLEFEAVSISATVYVNGTQAGTHQGGYTPFTFDVTDKITAGQDNLIAVRVDSRQQSSVPPEGGNLDFMIYGGIVRNVHLIIVDPLHVEWIFASTQNPSQSAPVNPTVSVKVKVVNNNASAKTCAVATSIADKSNRVVATASSSQSVPANGSVVASQTTSAIANPNLWDIDSPYLYTVYTQVKDGETVVDTYTERIGIRSITMSKTDGKFYINGKALKLRGLNRHETYPYIGRAAPRRLQRKDADILKYDLGCNIVRTSHYPQAPDFFDRCDEIGLLVLEEIPGWMYIGSGSWLDLEMQVLKDMVMRDRNHPSIFTWGVRINESADNNTFYRKTNDTAHALDPTRLTCGVRRSNSDPATSFLEDIWSQNFLQPSSSTPNGNMPVLTTEMIGHNYPAFSFSREDTLLGLMLAHATAQSNSYAQGKWGGMIGWCAFDYASSHANAVTLTGGRYVSDHGMCDIFRIPKFCGYFFQSQRDPAIYGPMIYVTNFWRSGSPTDLTVVSNCDQVELFVNGTSKGKIPPNVSTSLPQPVFAWSSSFTAGNLKADGYIGNNKVATHTWYTPSSPTKITLTPDTTTIFEGGDMTRVVVMVGDANNPFVPYDKTAVTLSATGAGDFIGESPISMENGVSAFYVRSRASQTGAITCSATATGLAPGSATITVVKKSNETKVTRAPTVIPIQSIAQKNIFKQVMNNTITVPGWAKEIAVYDLSGKRLLIKPVSSQTLNVHLNDIKAANSVRIVKLGRKTGATNNKSGYEIH
jgi:beta-galactosidase